MKVLDSRPTGPSWVADRLWGRLGISKAIFQVAADRRLEAELIERLRNRAGSCRTGDLLGKRCLGRALLEPPTGAGAG